MMTVREIAKQSGVSPGAIRYYSRIGLLRPRRNRRNRYQQYEHSDVLSVRFIRQAKNLGYTLKEIARIIEEARKGNSPCPLVRKIIGGRIVQNRSAINEMVALQKQMEKALAKWSKMPDRLPDGQSVCHLIESTGEL
jgi:DNA-binding transcriptional MerR regulator